MHDRFRIAKHKELDISYITLLLLDTNDLPRWCAAVRDIANVYSDHVRVVVLQAARSYDND